MNRAVVVLDADTRRCRETCTTIEEWGFVTTALHSLGELNAFIGNQSGIVIVMDIDTIRIDNRTIKKMVLENPGTYFLCLSRNRFHPELKDAICYHIYACINKPVDPDELFYCLNSIFEDQD